MKKNPEQPLEQLPKEDTRIMKVTMAEWATEFALMGKFDGPLYLMLSVKPQAAGG